ncbi:MAG: HEPN domain protein [Candidatus Bathyarchaeota archaeon BA1]|nr:MAG: HEPN domain protein [Candidatus Bathyarchaeota archaeon BA1]
MAEPLRNKREAVNHFVKKLLDVAKGQIAKVLIFGSLAKKNIRTESDIDVFILYFGDEEKILDITSELSFETALKYGESIEPFLMSIHEFNSRKNSSLFLREVLRNCEVIYEMSKNESDMLEAQDYVDLAEEFLTYAEGALKRKEFRAAIDQGYNAIELAIKALILIKGETLASSHGGIIQRLGRLYIITGEIRKEIGKNTRRSLTIRNKARYDPKAKITEEDATSIIGLAKELLDALNKKIKTKTS